VSLHISQGKTLGIIGESGSGKSTFAMALLRLQKSKGAIFFENTQIDTLKEKEIRPLRKTMQVVFQDPFASLSPRMSVEQIIAEGLHVHTNDNEEAITKKVIQALEEVGLDAEDRFRYPHEFSGGQRQRIAIALQKRLALTYIFISHDLKVIRAISHDIAVMKDGELLEHGATEDILSNPSTEYTKTLINSVLE